ncbi:MAG: ADP-ribosylglycohydrolase family protein [Myxococcales bacterium]|nr:ADP-ribosylglycohydrolase family protein [Myxococcales bacterium]MCB9642555.1 ADP-ribosylglycohydrolase family protein [Myxococcales bacterium]
MAPSQQTALTSTPTTHDTQPLQVTKEQLQACLWGLALGDAIGLPREGVSPRRAARLFGEGPLEHRLIGHFGMVSDDTEHHCMTAQAWLAANHDPQRFGRSLAWRLRGWLLGLPAGVGFATLRALLKLWVGFPPTRSGIYSAGNGPAMRAPILGLLCKDLPQMRTFVRASTRLTHTDPQAEAGAYLVAYATRLHAQSTLWDPSNRKIEHFWEKLAPHIEGEILQHNMKLVRDHMRQDADPKELMKAMGLQRGVTGYINHTVPVAIYCWLRHLGDFRGTIETAVKLGGDTDTVGAIAGGIAGAATPLTTFPQTWTQGLRETPRSLVWMERLADALHKETHTPIPLAWPLLPLRNFFFLLVVLFHGFRRLFPPY